MGKGAFAPGQARRRAFAGYPALLRWFEGGAWRGKFESNNLGNSLRLVLLHQYGGLYLDTDILSLRPATDLVNSIGIETELFLNNAVRNEAPWLMWRWRAPEARGGAYAAANGYADGLVCELGAGCAGGTTAGAGGGGARSGGRACGRGNG